MDTYLELISNYVEEKRYGLHTFSSVVEIVLISYVTFQRCFCQVQKCNSERNPFKGLLFFEKGEGYIWVDEDLYPTRIG